MEKKNEFFKPTPLYKEYVILDMFEKNRNITQREIAQKIGISVSMVNMYIDLYEKKGYLNRDYLTSRDVKYLITNKGKERSRLLNMGFLSSSQKIFALAKENIYLFLLQFKKNKINKILLYGAGEVAEILLNVIQNDRTISLDIVAIIDDDSFKIDHQLNNTPIISFKNVQKYPHDAILISSFSKNQIIYKKLLEKGYPKSRILNFFNVK